jgi:hypothetical protein
VTTAVFFLAAAHLCHAVAAAALGAVDAGIAAVVAVADGDLQLLYKMLLLLLWLLLLSLHWLLLLLLLK